MRGLIPALITTQEPRSIVTYKWGPPPSASPESPGSFAATGAEPAAHFRFLSLSMCALLAAVAMLMVMMKMVMSVTVASLLRLCLMTGWTPA